MISVTPYLCLSGLFRLENGSGIVCYHAYYIPDYLGRAQLADTLFDRQVGIKLEASSQIQEYLEGIKIIKSCGLSGERFSTLNRALLAMKKVAIQAELVSGVLVQSAALILQASLGIAIFVGTVLITGGQIELLPLLVLLMFSTQLYGPTLPFFLNSPPLPFREQSQNGCVCF